MDYLMSLPKTKNENVSAGMDTDEQFLGVFRLPSRVVTILHVLIQVDDMIYMCPTSSNATGRCSNFRVHYSR